MKKVAQWIVTLVSVGFIFPVFAAGKTLSPVGYWKTIDDVTGQPKAVIQIWQTPHQTLSGRIVRTFPTPRGVPLHICAACQGEKHNKPIIGLVIVEDLKQDSEDPDTWKNGSILDPRSGKIYHSRVKVVDEGHKLNVRGYIGAPLFGRTQTWLRVSH